MVRSQQLTFNAHIAGILIYTRLGLVMSLFIGYDYFFCANPRRKGLTALHKFALRWVGSASSPMWLRLCLLEEKNKKSGGSLIKAENKNYVRV